MKNEINSNNETCFKAHERLSLDCRKQSCRCWFDAPEHLNCINIATKKGPEKQEKIGKYFDLTRMRVCQIEKSIVTKIRKSKSLEQFSQ
jgi:hypothetical protein